jgi:hypothetical protein
MVAAGAAQPIYMAALMTAGLKVGRFFVVDGDLLPQVQDLYSSSTGVASDHSERGDPVWLPRLLLCTSPGPYMLLACLRE